MKYKIVLLVATLALVPWMMGQQRECRFDECMGDSEFTNGTLNLLTTGVIRGNVDVVATTGTSDTPDADELRGSFHTANNVGVVTYTLPDIDTVGSGASACFYDLDATAILTVDVDADDVIRLDGTALDAGDSIDSAGAAGDYICLLAIDGTTNWVTVGRSGTWVDGGP